MQGVVEVKVEHRTVLSPSARGKAGAWRRLITLLAVLVTQRVWNE